MANQFKHHYTRDEARALLPKVQQWLQQLLHYRNQVQHFDAGLSALLVAGADLGGNAVNDWVRQMLNLRLVLAEFETREIQIKDVERGLVDFPAVIGGKEVFLCWEKGEEDIEFWHDLDAGYPGRERL